MLALKWNLIGKITCFLRSVLKDKFQDNSSQQGSLFLRFSSIYHCPFAKYCTRQVEFQWQARKREVCTRFAVLSDSRQIAGRAVGFREAVMVKAFTARSG